MPGEGLCILAELPVEFGAFVVVVTYLVHCLRVVQAAIDHGVVYTFGVADVIQRIFVHHQQVGELAGLQAAYPVVQAQVDGRVHGGAAQGFEVGHAALCQHPYLPVCAYALYLAMRAHIHLHAGIQQLLHAFGYELVAVRIFLLGGHSAVAAAGVYYIARGEAEETFIFPHIGVLVPVVLTAECAIAYNEGRGVSCMGIMP